MLNVIILYATYIILFGFINAQTDNPSDDCSICDSWECDGYYIGSTDYINCINNSSLWLNITQCTHCTNCDISSNDTSLIICSCNLEENCIDTDSKDDDSNNNQMSATAWWAIMISVISVLAIFKGLLKQECVCKDANDD